MSADEWFKLADVFGAVAVGGFGGVVLILLGGLLVDVFNRFKGGDK